MLNSLRSRPLCPPINGRLAKIKDIEKRMSEISDLQKNIGTYGKTREIYNRYVKSKRSEKFYEEHRAEIALHQAAKAHFDSLGYGKDKKLPTIARSNRSTQHCSPKKKLSSGYHEVKATSRELLVAKNNADKILGVKPESQSRDASRGQNRSGTREG